MTLAERTLSYATFNALRNCIDKSYAQMADGGGVKITEAHAVSGEWFENRQSFDIFGGQPMREPGSYLSDGTDSDSDSTDGWTQCNTIVKTGMSLWGYADGKAFLCSFVDVRSPNGPSCLTGTGDFDYTSFHDSLPKFDSVVRPKAYANPAITDAGRYLLNKSAFFKACKPTESANPSANFAYKNIRIVADDGTYSDKTYEGSNRGDVKKVYTSNDFSYIERNCGQIADNMNTYAKAYSDYRKANPTEAASGTTTPATPEECASPNPPASCSTSGATSCAIDGVGWIICPVVNFLAGVADASYQLLSNNLLRTDVNILTVGGPVYKIWTLVRNIANLLFVIAFLIIIFSQLTSVGISNYGVKKMLPRLIAAAILVNLSFFICSIAVDLSNLSGYGVHDLFASVTASVGGTTASGDGVSPFATGEGFIGIVGTVLAGTIAIAIVYALLSLIIPLLIAAAVAVVVILFVLIARQALIVALIILSPLAFVAFLLPNTEKMFTQWRKIFTAMLLLFPIVAFVYGISQLGSVVLTQAFNGDASTSNATFSDDTANNFFGQLIGAAVAIIPLFAVPILLKKSLESIPQLAGLAQRGFGLTKKSTDAYKNSNYGKFRSTRDADRRARIATGTYVGAGGNFNPSNWKSRLNRKLNASRPLNLATGGFGASQQLAAEAQDRKDRSDAIAMFGNDDTLITAWAKTGGNMDEARALKDASGKRILTDAQLEQMQKMRDAGQHRKPSSHLAAAQYLSENGKGTSGDIIQLLDRAKAAGAPAPIVDGAEQAAIASYRKSGRGDVLAQLQTRVNIRSGKKNPNVTAADAFAEIAASSVHRDGIDIKFDAAGVPIAGSESTGFVGYQEHLTAKRDNLIAALVGFDSIEARARPKAEVAILRAFQAQTGRSAASVKEAKEVLNVR